MASSRIRTGDGMRVVRGQGAGEGRMQTIIMVRSEEAASVRETGPPAAVVREQPLPVRTHATAGPTLRLTQARIRLYPIMMPRLRMSSILLMSSYRELMAPMVLSEQTTLQFRALYRTRQIKEVKLLHA